MLVWAKEAREGQGGSPTHQQECIKAQKPEVAFTVQEPASWVTHISPPAPCPTAAPQGTALPGGFGGEYTVPVVTVSSPDADCLSGIYLPSSFQTGSWLLDHCQETCCEPTVCQSTCYQPTPCVSSPVRVTSRQTTCVSSPVQCPAGHHLYLQWLSASEWRSTVCKPVRSISTVCQPVGGVSTICQPTCGSPGRTSSPACPAAEEFAKFRSPWVNQDSMTCQLRFQDLPTCCLSDFIADPCSNCLIAGCQPWNGPPLAI